MSEERRKPAAISAYQSAGIAPFASFPYSYSEMREMTATLRLAERDVLERFFTRIYQFGAPLSDDSDELAAIAGVGRGRWALMAPFLAPFFRIDDDGWHHPGLEEAHRRYFEAQEDDRLYRERQAEHRRKGHVDKKLREAADAEKQRRAALAQVREAEAQELPDGFADGLGSGKVGPRSGLGDLPEMAADPTAAPPRSPVAPRGLTEFSLSDEKSKFCSPKETYSPSVSPSTRDSEIEDDARACRAGEGFAKGEAGDPTSTLATDEAGGGEGGGGDPTANLAASAPPGAVPSRQRIVDVIRAAAGNNLSPNWESPNTITRIQGWVTTGGLDIEAHFGEAVRMFARKSLEPMTHPASDLIYKIACEIRDGPKPGTVAVLDAKARASFETFWELYPHKMARPIAYREWCALFKERNGDMKAVLDGLKRYSRDKPHDTPWLNPATFLRDRRWEDEAAPQTGRNGGERNLRILKEKMHAARGAPSDPP